MKMHLLERDLHVHWLWPGKLGEVILRQEDLSLTPADAFLCSNPGLSSCWKIWPSGIN
jgi:hypothetical protein